MLKKLKKRVAKGFTLVEMTIYKYIQKGIKKSGAEIDSTGIDLKGGNPFRLFYHIFYIFQKIFIPSFPTFT